jgi:hypothetical protein
MTKLGKIGAVIADSFRGIGKRYESLYQGGAKIRVPHIETA